MKHVSGVLIFAILLVTACSSVQESPDPLEAEVAPAQEAHSTSEIDISELPPTDPKVMEHVLSAEVLGAEGDLSGASAQYLEAALLSEDPEIAERASRVAVSAGEWQMVALASDRWAMLDPTSLDARELAAGSRLREGDYVGAEFQLGKLLELTRENPSQGWRIVTLLLAPAHDQEKADKVLNNLLQEFDAESNVDALFARSHLAASQGDLSLAAELVDRAIELEPAKADLLAWAGRLAINQGDSTLALERYRQAWVSNPDDPQIAIAYAELLKRNDDTASAQEVLAQVPDTPEMRFARIVFALDAGDRQTAEALYRGFPGAGYADASNIAFQAAQSAELLDLKSEAIHWYKQVTGEQSLRATMRQAFLLAVLGDVEEARNLLKRLRLQGSGDIKAQSYQLESQILRDAGRVQEAMKVMNIALTDLPSDTTLRYQRALLAVELDQLDLAESDLRGIISVEPDNAAAINALGYTLADRTDRYEEAEQLIHQAYQMEPQDASIIDSMGWIAYRLGRLEEAGAYLREAWKSLPNAEIAAHLGEVLWVLGRKEEARTIWKRGLELDNGQNTLIETMQRFGESP